MRNDKLSIQSMDFAVSIINLMKSLKEKRESIVSINEKRKKRTPKQMFAFRLNNSGFTAAIDFFKIEKRFVVDVMRVSFAHSSASEGDVLPRFAENVTSSQDRASDGIVKRVDQIRREDLLLVHF